MPFLISFSLELLLTIRLQCKVPFVNGFEQSRNVMPTRKRFTDDEIREIRLSPQSARYLAQRYDVSHPTIMNIRDRRTYKQVPDHLGADLKNKFVIHDAVEFLAELPDGYCGTAITAPPIREVRSVIGQRGGWTTVDERQAEQEYLELQRRIISECLRVVGPDGVLLYHYRYDISSRRNINLRHEIISDFPLRQVVIWNHGMRRFTPGGRHFNRLPNSYSMIYVISGPRWSIPEASRAAAMRWGDLWDIRPDSMDRLWSDSRRQGGPHPHPLPSELADRFVALGSGMVLSPFAGAGDVALAAIRAGRDWLACDPDPACLKAFQMRRYEMASDEFPAIGS